MTESISNKNTNYGDPRDIIDTSPMSVMQVCAVATCILLTALDGFDVLSISFASPGIAIEWGIDRGALGIVLSMELIGMALGSIIFGGFADRVGRRPTVLFCLTVMAIGMYFSGAAESVATLSFTRFYTGLAIGGMLASCNALVAEFSNLKYRNLSVILMASGYPLGVIIGGSFASHLLNEHTWRSIFYFGAVITIMMFPIVWFFLPESIAFLSSRRPKNALNRVNQTLSKMKYAVLDKLPEVKVPEKVGVKELFSPDLIMVTVTLVLAYFLHIMTFYFILKWIPKIVVDMGYSASMAGSVLVWANIGGLSGSLLLSILAYRFPIKKLLIGIFIGSAITVILFGSKKSDLNDLSLMAAIAGFFTNSGVVGLYALMAISFPDRIRASGTGFVIGVGRGGAALSPAFAGLLFVFGFGLEGVSTMMALGSLIAAIVILFLNVKK